MKGKGKPGSLLLSRFPSFPFFSALPAAPSSAVVWMGEGEGGGGEGEGRGGERKGKEASLFDVRSVSYSAVSESAVLLLQKESRTEKKGKGEKRAYRVASSISFFIYGGPEQLGCLT